MKKLYQVTCCGMVLGGSYKSRDSIYVIAENEKEASEMALSKMKELKYDKIDNWVYMIKTIADEKDNCDGLLILR